MSKTRQHLTDELKRKVDRHHIVVCPTPTANTETPQTNSHQRESTSNLQRQLMNCDGVPSPPTRVAIHDWSYTWMPMSPLRTPFGNCDCRERSTALGWPQCFDRHSRVRCPRPRSRRSPTQQRR